MSKRKKPHVHPVDEAWLALGAEPKIAPFLDIVDSHIHLWDFGDPPYFANSYRRDAGDADIVASVFVDCTMAYRETGPDAFAPVGEVEFARAQGDFSLAQGDFSAGPVQIAAAIVGWADLTLGDGVGPVLAELIAAGGGRLRGIRTRATYDPDPAAGYGADGIGPGLLLRDDFRQGVACLQDAGLALEIYAFHTQLGEVADLARAFPALPIVLDHIGGPIGVGHYADRREQVFADWVTGLRQVAACPNVSIKIGGFAISRIAIVSAAGAARPPSSAAVAAACKPWVDECLASFGAGRCMFGSNFPVDKAALPMRSLVNAMKLLTAHLDLSERKLFFAGNARRFYAI